MKKGDITNFSMRIDDTFRFENHRVSSNDELKRMILEEVNEATYAVHPDSTKMYKDLKETYWWNNMKHEIADFVSKCLTYQ